MGGAVSKINFKEGPSVTVEPAPDVHVLLSLDGVDVPVVLKMNSTTDVAFPGVTLKATLVSIERKLDRKPTNNNKNFYYFVLPDGKEHIEYVRSEDRARERFAQRFPDTKVILSRIE